MSPCVSKELEKLREESFKAGWKAGWEAAKDRDTEDHCNSDMGRDDVESEEKNEDEDENDEDKDEDEDDEDKDDEEEDIENDEDEDDEAEPHNIVTRPKRSRPQVDYCKKGATHNEVDRHTHRTWMRKKCKKHK